MFSDSSSHDGPKTIREAVQSGLALAKADAQLAQQKANAAAAAGASASLIVKRRMSSQKSPANSPKKTAGKQVLDESGLDEPGFRNRLKNGRNSLKKSPKSTNNKCSSKATSKGSKQTSKNVLETSPRVLNRHRKQTKFFQSE